MLPASAVGAACFCCWRTVPSTAGAVALLDHTQEYAEEAARREVMIQVRQPGFVGKKV